MTKNKFSALLRQPALFKTIEDVVNFYGTDEQKQALIEKKKIGGKAITTLNKPK